MTIKVGEPIPDVKLARMGKDGPEVVTTGDLFGGRKVVLFALPGAYTPTCSAAHLPGFVVHADEILSRGVDRIACLSVNDAFVMDAWGRDHNAERIDMLADGNAEFARAVGLELDLSERLMGVRSQRYAMIIDDGVVRFLAVEAPGKFEVSSAEEILKQL